MKRNCRRCGAIGEWKHNLEPPVYKKKILEIRESGEGDPHTSILGAYICEMCERDTNKTNATMRCEEWENRNHEQAPIEHQARENAPGPGGAASRGIVPSSSSAYGGSSTTLQAPPAFSTRQSAFQPSTTSDHDLETSTFEEEARKMWLKRKDIPDDVELWAGLEGFVPESNPLLPVPEGLVSGGASAAQTPAPIRSNKKRSRD